MMVNKKRCYSVLLLLICTTLLLFTGCPDDLLPQFTLTIEVDGEGSVNPAEGTHTYAINSVEDLEATPDQGWTFSHWEGDVADTQNPITTITMDEDKTVKAFFEEEEELPVVYISSNIDSNETWDGDTIYVIESSISINAILTIEPGAIIKFEEGNRMTVRSSGGLLAEGTAEEPIIFTSIKDDEHGGDTNEDGDLTKPSPGDWEYVYNNGGTAIFDYCEFYYGGGAYNDHTLHIDGTTTLTNSTFAYNNGDRRGALYAESGATIEGNTFYDNVKPILLHADISIDDSNIFHNPSDPDEVNTFQGIFIHGSRISRNVTWDATEAPFVLQSNLSINEGYSLTLGAGVIMKFDESYLRVNGILNAVGEETDPIIFTSYRDDAHGGDSNGDDGFTTPDVGDWEYITIRGTATFDHCEFYYGGGAYYDYTLHIDGTTTLTNSTFAYNNGDRRGTLYAESGATIEGNTFYDNVKPILLHADISIDDSNIFHNPSDPHEVNTFQGIFIDGSRISRNVTWDATEAPFVLQSNLSINEDYSLTLGEGVIMKFDESYLRVNGILNAEGEETDPIIFTSYRDDAHGGDSNGDGGSTSPSMGDWEYIYIDGTATFDHCEFYYGGGAYDDYTLSANRDTRVSDSTFAYNNGDRRGTLDIRESATFIDNTFYSNVKPLRVDIEVDIDDSNRFHNPNNPNEVNTFQGIFIDGSSISNHVTWEESEVAIVLRDGDTTITQHTGSLTLGDGVVLKFRLGRRLNHYNNIHDYDLPGVYFTSYRDDSRGGDSNGDGGMTSPAPGDWVGIRNNAAPDPYFETWSNILYAETP